MEPVVIALALLRLILKAKGDFCNCQPDSTRAVCGSDYRTYGNECQMHCNKDLHVLWVGTCENSHHSIRPIYNMPIGRPSHSVVDRQVIRSKKEVVSQPASELVARPIGKDVVSPMDGRPSHPVVDHPFDRRVIRSKKEVVPQPASEFVARPIEKDMVGPMDGRPSHPVVDRPIDRPVIRPGKKVVVQPPSKLIARPIEKAVVSLIDGLVVRPVNQPDKRRIKG